MSLAPANALRPMCLISRRPGVTGQQHRQPVPLQAAHHGLSSRGLTRCRTASGADTVPAPEEPEVQQPASAASSKPAAAQPEPQAKPPSGGLAGWLKAQQQKGTEGKSKLAALGLAAVLAYGLFDGISYTIAFSIAFLGYEAKTGLNPTQNVADLVKICVLMWAGNNVTRPFRIAGAAALAPFMDKLMDTLQEKLRLPKKFYAFLLVVMVVAGSCLSVLGALFLSRWVRG